MWIYDYTNSDSVPYRQAPFVTLDHLSYIDNLPHWVYPHHSHEDVSEIAFIMEGSGQVDLLGASVEVSKGSIISIPPGVHHRMNCPQDGSMIYCTMSFRSLDEEQEDSLPAFFRNLGVATTDASAYNDYIHSTLYLLFNLHHVNQGVVDETIQSIVLGLLQLCRELFTSKALLVRLDDQHSASDILHYIMASSGVGITLESLAEHFSVSQSHLSRIFCNAYHVSPINYAIHARITYATEFLLKSDLPIPEIASHCGYDNPVHFTNMFLKRIGCTPQEYRDRNQHNFSPFSDWSRTSDI